MPLGRKHFRRSRDAPILLRKGLWTSPGCQRSLFLKTCIYLSRRRTLVKVLDGIDRLGDSEGDAASRTRPEARSIGPFAEDHSRKQRAENQQGLSSLDRLVDLLLAVQSSFVFRAGIFCVCPDRPGMFARIDKNGSNY